MRLPLATALAAAALLGAAGIAERRMLLRGVDALGPLAVADAAIGLLAKAG